MARNNRKDDAIYGQYPSDRIGREKGFRDSTGTLAARGDGQPDFHVKGLFDQDDHLPDIATGEVKTGSSEYEEHGLAIIELGRKATAPIDKAERWLMENDPAHPRYTGKKKK